MRHSQPLPLDEKKRNKILKQRMNAQNNRDKKITHKQNITKEMEELVSSIRKFPGYEAYSLPSKEEPADESSKVHAHSRQAALSRKEINRISAQKSRDIEKRLKKQAEDTKRMLSDLLQSLQQANKAQAQESSSFSTSSDASSIAKQASSFTIDVLLRPSEQEKNETEHLAVARASTPSLIPSPSPAITSAQGTKVTIAALLGL